MKYITAASLALSIVLAATLFIAEAEEEPKPAPPKPEKAAMTQAQKESYVIGMFVANDIKKMDVKLDMAFFTRGFFDAYNGQKFQVSNNEVRPTFTAIMNRTREKMRREQEEAAARSSDHDVAKASHDGGQECEHARFGGEEHPVILRICDVPVRGPRPERRGAPWP